ncbi:hypothetical protein J6590_024501 [Homalodisca vitripennis]|nr:hypothetical protein J6590_024501 [Homalodisca vitripennis]
MRNKSQRKINPPIIRGPWANLLVRPRKELQTAVRSTGDTIVAESVGGGVRDVVSADNRGQGGRGRKRKCVLHSCGAGVRCGIARSGGLPLASMPADVTPSPANPAARSCAADYTLICRGAALLHLQEIVGHTQSPLSRLGPTPILMMIPTLASRCWADVENKEIWRRSYHVGESWPFVGEDGPG